MAGRSLVGERYLQRLNGSDRQLLAGACGASPDPASLPDLLSKDEVYDAVFAGPARQDPFHVASPFLTFAVAVARTGRDLAGTSYVPEWVGPRQRVPVFDGGELLAFLAEEWPGLFLAELLASFSHVASGSYLARTARGWRRRRWNELDPVRLAGLLDALPPAEHAGVYRRLGDLALFLTGVFPDHTQLYALRPLDAARLLAAAGVRTGTDRPRPDGSALELVEWLGSRWYRKAAARAVAVTADTRIVSEVAERFRSARRLLNLVSDRYLFPAGRSWFPSPPGP